MKHYTRAGVFKKNKYLFVLLLVFFCNGVILAGNIQEDPDQMFYQARDFANNNNYPRARAICDQILEKYPDYHDASILKARTFAWEQEYPQAREILKNVLKSAPQNKEALYALIDVDIWSKNFQEALINLDIALNDHPNNTHLLYRKAMALNGIGDDVAAVVLLNQILDLDPSYKQAKELLDAIEIKRLKNHFALGYRGHYFIEDPSTDPWHLYYIELGRKTNFFGPLIGRVNVANREALTGFQFEVDAYPSIKSGTYLYLNFGYSPDKELFPVTRFGFELHQALPASWEASAGFRLLNFQAKDLVILTGSISKYFRKYYFSFRPYFSFSSEADAQVGESYFLTMKRFFTSSDHYLSLIVGRGFSADYDKLLGGQLYDLGGTIAEGMLLYQQRLSTRWLFKIGAGYKLYDIGLSTVPWGDPVVLEGGIICRF